MSSTVTVLADDSSAVGVEESAPCRRRHTTAPAASVILPSSLAGWRAIPCTRPSASGRCFVFVPLPCDPGRGASARAASCDWDERFFDIVMCILPGILWSESMSTISEELKQW